MYLLRVIRVEIPAVTLEGIQEEIQVVTQEGTLEETLPATVQEQVMGEATLPVIPARVLLVEVVAALEAQVEVAATQEATQVMQEMRAMQVTEEGIQEATVPVIAVRPAAREAPAEREVLMPRASL